MINKIAYFIIGASLIIRLSEAYTIQPSHLGMIFFIIFNLANASTQRSTIIKFNFDMMLVSLCLLYCSLINLLNSYQSFSILLILNPIALMLAYISLYICKIRIEIIKLILSGATFAFIFSIILGLLQFIESPFSRIIGLSGTPNHLAMQGIILLALSLAFYPISRVTTVNRVIFFIGAALSLSRSALAGLALYLITNFNNIFLKKRTLIISMLLSPVLLVISSKVINLLMSFSSFELVQIMQLFESRLVFFNSSDDGGRGLYRLMLYPEYLFFGASEMRSYFYGDSFIGFIHNNLAQMWFAFGIPGLLLALHQIYLIYKSSSYKGLLLFLPFLMTHFVYQNFLFNFYIMSLIILIHTNTNLINYKHLSKSNKEIYG